MKAKLWNRVRSKVGEGVKVRFWSIFFWKLEENLRMDLQWIWKVEEMVWMSLVKIYKEKVDRKYEKEKGHPKYIGTLNHHNFNGKWSTDYDAKTHLQNEHICAGDPLKNKT